MEHTKFHKKEDIIQYFQNLWPDSKPLAKLFKTEAKGYLYDTGTNKIFACEGLEYSLLNDLFSMDIKDAVEKNESGNGYSQKEYFKAFETIRSIIDEANVLKTKKESIQFDLLSKSISIDECINNALDMIIIEVTEKCNLRCGYCIYNNHNLERRNHGTHDMSQETAFRSIDYLAQHSSTKESVGITFYGGEPLLSFPLIQSCVEYAHKVFGKKKHRFSMTTNATLMTSTMAKFFAEEDFGILVSLDGPEDVHDQYRKDSQGNGSFKKTTEGLKKLYIEYGENKQKIALSTVFAPPHSEQKLNRILELWEEHPWIHKNPINTFSYNTDCFCNKKKLDKIKWQFSLFEWSKKNYLKDYRKGQKTNIIASSSIEARLISLVKRLIYSQPQESYALNGCCIPAVRKLYISVDGSFSICERVGQVPEIGNIENGINLEQIHKIYINEYAEKSISYCSDCWALNLCSICYQAAYFDNEYNSDKKNIECEGFKRIILRYIELYCSLLEINKSGLDHLNDVIVT